MARKGGSSYRGVRTRTPGQWTSEIRHPTEKKQIWLGSFDDEKMAAVAFDVATFCFRGPRALLNFPTLAHLLPNPRSSSVQHIQEAVRKEALEAILREARSSGVELAPMVMDDAWEQVSPTTLNGVEHSRKAIWPTTLAGGEDLDDALHLELSETEEVVSFFDSQWPAEIEAISKCPMYSAERTPHSPGKSPWGSGDYWP